jgi:membrane protein YqaA with SNARE-associated domain
MRYISPRAHHLGGLLISILSILSVQLAVLATSRIVVLFVSFGLNWVAFVALATLGSTSGLGFLSWLLGCLRNTITVCRSGRAGSSGCILGGWCATSDLLAVLELESGLLDDGLEATLPRSGPC